MEVVLCWSRWCAEVSTPQGCSHEGSPWALCSCSGTCAESDCNHRAAPLKLVTELCINLTHSLNPDIYKYVRNTNSNVLWECSLSLLYVPRQKMCFVPVLGAADEVLEVRWQHSRSSSAATTDVGKNRFPSPAGVAQSELKASPVQDQQELLATDHFGSKCGS